MLQPTTAGVRVTKKIQRNDGGSVAVVVSEVMKTSMPLTQIRIADGIEAPFCETLEDFYALSSRLTIRRLLADYLDQKVLLVSEVLHCADEADKLLAVLPLMKSAVMTAAGSHARLTGRDGAASRNTLNKRVEEMAARARTARSSYQRNYKSRQAFGPLVERFGKASSKPGEKRMPIRRFALRARPCRLHRTAGCARLDGQAVPADRLALRAAGRLCHRGAGRADRRPVRLQRRYPRVVRPRCRSQPAAVPAVRRRQGGRNLTPADLAARQPAGTRPPVRRRPPAPGPAGGPAAYSDPAQRRQGFGARHQGVVLHDAAGAAGDRKGRGRRAGNGRGADVAPCPHAGAGRAGRPEGGDGPAAGPDGRAGPQDQLYPGPGPFADVPAPAPPDAGSARRHGRQAKADQQLRRQRVAPRPEDEGAEQYPRAAQRRPASRRYPVEAAAHGRDGLHRLPDRKPHPGEDRQSGFEPAPAGHQAGAALHPGPADPRPAAGHGPQPAVGAGGAQRFRDAGRQRHRRSGGAQARAGVPAGTAGRRAAA